MTARGALTLVLLLSLVSARAAAAEPHGSIHGKVRYVGPRVVRQRVHVHTNAEVCGAKSAILEDDLVVGAGSGLANAVVVLAGITERNPKRADARLVQKNCVFSPHVQTVTLGSQLIIGNDDPVIHNVHARVGGETVFNLGMPLRGLEVKRKLEVPGVAVIHCDSGHTWMRAYVVVVPHSYHTTTTADGELVLTGIVPGTYTLRSWHERLGLQDTTVTVSAGQKTEVEIVYARDPGPPEDPSRIMLGFAVAGIGARTVGDEEAPSETPSSAPSSPSASAPFAPSSPSSPSASFDAAGVRLAGRPLFLRHCAPCHGDAGDGRGEAARFLRTRPRNFLRGEYKLRSTPTGRLPTEDDLVRTISTGLPGTDMPPWRRTLSLGERRLLARYVMSLSDRFVRAPPARPIEIPPEGPADAASIARGRTLYNRLHCAQCHGEAGDAEGESKQMVDDTGSPIVAADLTRGVYASGPTSRDLHRTLVTGLSGTPMPAFGDLIGPNEIWDLVHYVQSLAGDTRLRELLGVP